MEIIIAKLDQVFLDKVNQALPHQIKYYNLEELTSHLLEDLPESKVKYFPHLGKCLTVKIVRRYLELLNSEDSSRFLSLDFDGIAWISHATCFEGVLDDRVARSFNFWLHFDITNKYHIINFGHEVFGKMPYNELEEKIQELEKENEELREKLDQFQDIPTLNFVIENEDSPKSKFSLTTEKGSYFITLEDGEDKVYFPITLKELSDLGHFLVRHLDEEY